MSKDYERINAYLPIEIYNKVVRIAEQEDIKKTKVVTEILNNFFNQCIIKEDGTIEYIGTGK
jgi:hypothetical protein